MFKKNIAKMTRGTPLPSPPLPLPSPPLPSPPLPSPPLPSPPLPFLPLVTQRINSPFQPKQSPSKLGADTKSSIVKECRITKKKKKKKFL